MSEADPEFDFEVEDGVVPLLEELLARAKAGEIKSVALTLVLESGIIECDWFNDGQFAVVAGAISCLQHDFLTRTSESEDQETEDLIESMEAMETKPKPRTVN